MAHAETQKLIAHSPLYMLLFIFLSTPADIVAQQDVAGRSASAVTAAFELGTPGISTAAPGAPTGPQALREQFFTGAAQGDNFGYSVSNAGDVNGDGYDDVIVGAHQNDAGGTNAGRAYIYYGGRSLNSSPDVILTGDASGDLFGSSVSAAGDVNGDGYDDVVVGAPSNDLRGTNAGLAHIFLGGASMDNIPDIRLLGETAGDNFGHSAATAGDVNGDSYSDVIVGAPLNDNRGVDAGRAYIFLGGASMNNAPDVTLTGERAGDRFGHSVSGAEDLNGDGYADVLVGAPFNDTRGTDAGRAYVFFGRASPDNVPDLPLDGKAAFDQFGYAVANAGDVNGDGYSDAVVGAPFDDNAGNDAGGAFLYFGGPSMNDDIDRSLFGEATNDNLGYSVSSAGDVNGDGYSDVLVGIPFSDAGGADAGGAYAFFGSADADDVKDMMLTGAVGGDNFGFSVSSAGDVNGDGYSDLIVGAWQNDAGASNAGSAFLYTNTLAGTDIPDLTFLGGAAGDRFGTSVASAGDVNGDGFGDLIVGAYLNDAGGNNAGRAYIYLGGEGFDNVPDLTLTGATAPDWFGFSVSTAGDVNGDGYDDVIVGAYRNDSGIGIAGRAYICFGGPGMDNVSDVTLEGELNDGFGYSVSTAGDVNGDGFDDVIIGAKFAGDGGRAYIYYGSTNMNAVSDVTLTFTGAQFGWSVSTAGDVNADGFDDVIVGDPWFGDERGYAAIFLGGPNMDNEQDVLFAGEDSFRRVGGTVSAAGDVNGDGFDDVIVGPNIPTTSDVSILFGGAEMDNVPDITLRTTIEFPDLTESFGASVSAAGDVNGDGYDDVLVGAPGYYLSQTGSAYIYFGGQSMDAIADITFADVGVSAQFGYSTATAGDVNGDGSPDAIVGAWLNDDGGEDAGRAYLFLSASPPVNPRIMSIQDVPADQGGRVLVNFVRSSFDAIGQSRLSGYAVEMSAPPVNGRYNWIQLGTVTPLQYPKYSFLAHTLGDSSGTTGGTHYFRVTARASSGDDMFSSNIAYGNSIDNLAPSAPLDFRASADQQSIRLSWRPNSERDLKEYRVYRSNAYPAPDPELVGVTADSTLVDSTTGYSYYFVNAVDVHDNAGAFAVDSTSLVSVEDGALISAYELFQNYPNPFNPATTIKYNVSGASHVSLIVYDVLGNEVSTLVDAFKPAGSHEVRFDASGSSSSIYFYKLRAGNFVSTKKMLFVK